MKETKDSKRGVGKTAAVNGVLRRGDEVSLFQGQPVVPEKHTHVVGAFAEPGHGPDLPFDPFVVVRPGAVEGIMEELVPETGDVYGDGPFFLLRPLHEKQPDIQGGFGGKRRELKLLVLSLQGFQKIRKTRIHNGGDYTPVRRK